MVNTNKLNDWLSLTANVGVILGIVFLAIEIQQNTSVQLANSRQQMLEVDLEIIDDRYEDPEFFLNLSNPDLSEVDSIKRRAHWLKLMRSREFAYYQYQDGLMDEVTWESYLSPMFGFFGSGPGRRYIERGAYGGSQEFNSYLLGRLSQIEE
jgi:hypothetical protein